LCNFNKDYYENGIKKGLSGYENYHYIPTRSYSEAIELINRFDFNSIIDYGAAKGFLVHALRQLGKEAYGEDISDYAIENCLPDVQNYMSKPGNRQVDFMVGKDVLEHVHEDEMLFLLEFLYTKANQFLFVIPLGEDGMYRIREYEVDKSHYTKRDEDWWIDIFRLAGFKIKTFDYSMGRIKEKWTGVYPFGNGFFVLGKK
jgi:predicted TPR repeat methyltransferase